MANTAKKPTKFIAHGPFKIPVQHYRNGAKAIANNPALKKFWDREVGENLSDRNGCYVFAVQAGPAIMPWYVGRTTAQTFALECFSGDKPKKYEQAMGNYAACTPLLFLLESSTTIATKKIMELEQFLIELAAAANPKIQQTKGIPRPLWVIPGVTQSNGQGKVSDTVLKFRDAFNLEPPKRIKTAKKIGTKKAAKGKGRRSKKK